MRNYLVSAALLLLAGCGAQQKVSNHPKPHCDGACAQRNFKSYDQACRHGCGGMCW